MGVLRLYLKGDINSLKFPSFIEASKIYKDWWSREIKIFVKEGLLKLLLINEDETETINEIKQFRKNYVNIYNNDDIRLDDIIRFKALKIYNWLYTELKKKYMARCPG